MKVYVNVVTFILKERASESKKKNDIPEIKVLLNNKHETLKKELLEGSDMKKTAINLVEENLFVTKPHLEQVYTLDKDGTVNVIYLCVLNSADIKKINEEYIMHDFDIKVNDNMKIGKTVYKYITKEIIDKKNSTYFHEFKNVDKDLAYELLMVLMSYKYIKSRIDITDIIFKFLPSKFTLEEVRLLYEFITGKTVDKSNFRKKIASKCKGLDEIIADKGYRPTRLYTYEAPKNNIWI